MIPCKLSNKTLFNYNKLKPYLDGDMIVTGTFMQEYQNTLVDLANDIQQYVNCMNRQETNVNEQYKNDIERYKIALYQIRNIIDYNAKNIQAREDFITIRQPDYNAFILLVVFSIIFLLITVYLI
jgi:hypothetical protein